MKRLGLTAAAALLAVAAFVAVGRWEREHRADVQSAGMRAVRKEIGPLDSPELRGFRIFVNFHCLVDPALTVQAVHEKVDEVERALRRRSPSIKRVIGHAEPRDTRRSV